VGGKRRPRARSSPRDAKESLIALRVRALLDASPDSALLLAADGTVLAVNAIAARRLDTTPERLLGKNIFDFLGREVAAGRRKALTDVVRTGAPAVFEDRARDSDWSLSMVPITGPGRAVDSVAVFARDLTRERRTAHELRLAAAALSAAANAIVITDAEGRIELVNPAFTHMTGYAGDEVLGQTPRVLKSGTHEAGFYAELWRTIRAGRVWRGEMMNRRKDGTLYPEEQVITPVCGPGGTVTHFIAVKQDVSERRAAAEALRRREAYFRALIEEAHDLIGVVDVNGCFRYTSPSFDRVLGYPPEALSGQNAFAFVHPDDLPSLLAVFTEHTRAPGQTATAQYRFRHRDGSWRWIESVGRNLMGDPVVGGAIINSRDITERRRAEEAQARLQARVAQSEKLTAMGELLAGVAHELNNPLSVVLGHAMMLQQKASDEAARVRADKIAAAATRCVRIVKNFLALAREHAPERTLTDLNAVAREAVELVAYPLRVDAIEVVLDLAPDVPGIWADPHQLQQVVVNLATNARHAMRDTATGRRLTIATRPEPGDRVSLHVADTGPGIPPDVERRLFEPFFTTKPLGEGTGLGLPICKGIVERHGGRLTLDPGPGRGATFRVELPVGRPVEATPASEAAAPVARLSVLVVDDEPEVVGLVADILALDGHTVDGAGSGEEALERLARRTYDAILSDIKMPGLDGPGLHREVCRRHPALAPRMAFFTGDTLGDATSAFLAQTRAASIRKPFSVDDVRAALARLTAAAADRPGGPGPTP
jgi:PAS domain S-box-containing protein